MASKKNSPITLIVFGEQVTITAVNKYTTCDDAIKMALRNKKIENMNRIGMFESARGVHKLISKNTHILKLIRSWGPNRDDYSLILRKLDSIKSKMASITRAKNKLNKLRSLLGIAESTEKVKHNLTINYNLDNANTKEEKYSYKSLHTKDNALHSDSMAGKLSLMKRFLRDIDTSNENTYSCDTLSLSTNPESIIDDQTNVKLNDAFTKPVNEQTYIINNDKISNTCFDSANLNDCFIAEYGSLNYTESAFGDMSEDGSVCELERNICDESLDTTVVKLDKIKSMFSRTDLTPPISEDEALESFMNTLIKPEVDNDEGLSSMGSDDMYP